MLRSGLSGLNINRYSLSPRYSSLHKFRFLSPENPLSTSPWIFSCEPKRRMVSIFFVFNSILVKYIYFYHLTILPWHHVLLQYPNFCLKSFCLKLPYLIRSIPSVSSFCNHIFSDTDQKTLPYLLPCRL